MLFRILFTVSAVPLAVFLSCQGPNHLGRPATEHSISHSGESRNKAREQAAEQVMKQTRLFESLLQEGLEENSAKTITYQAQCLTNLDPDASFWASGQRYSGVLLIPDSAAALCGFETMPLWQFRASMRGPEIHRCAARLLRGQPHSSLQKAHRELVSQNPALAPCLTESKSFRVAEQDTPASGI